MRPQTASPFAVGLAALMTFLVAGTLAAQSDYPADTKAISTTSCQRDVERAIRSSRPRVEKVEYTADSLRQRQESSSETSIWGNGRVSQGDGWEPFVFRCVYNEQKGALTTVDYNFQQPAGESSAPRKDADQGAPWTAACKQAIHEKVRQQHANAQSISIDSAAMKQWQESDSEIGVSGGGRFVGARGQENRFIFRCLYNNTEHKLSSSNWQTRD